MAYRMLGDVLRRSIPRQPVYPFSARRGGPIRRALQYFAGYGKVSGVVTVSGTPVSRRVRLFEAKSARLIAETWSDAAGQYSFTGISAALEYFVTAHDHTLTNDAVIHDAIVPEVMV